MGLLFQVGKYSYRRCGTTIIESYYYCDICFRKSGSGGNIFYRLLLFKNLQGSETIAHLLLKALSRPKARTLVSSQRDWLMAVHTLAMNDSLPQEIGETVLGKEFVDELLKSSK